MIEPTHHTHAHGEIDRLYMKPYINKGRCRPFTGFGLRNELVCQNRYRWGRIDGGQMIHKPSIPSGWVQSSIRQGQWLPVSYPLYNAVLPQC